ncbi:flagellar hook-associated protein FlgK [Brevundimonas sp.]|jgi:flagellar hook-associated protein 1|uniref:flagellar hook-associated protein FlgK n=1 Tax=Brevundimonas sp. TaxID=1871086 RepID=UPI0018441BF0|nr:flagellar hook-associated protein FlgK [Brevundimonas sp.]MBA4807780.1 flagellar hook-associated protein FlgK [Brevundimonas sp.]
MSLSGALANASAALTTSQYQVALSTTNVANASTDGYTTKTYSATSQTATLALSTGELSRVTDTYLQKSLISSSASAGYAETIDSYMSRYDTLLGDTSSSGDIASLTSALATSLTTLAAGTGDTDAAAVVSAASELADGLRTLSSGIQDLRSDADAAIATTVDEINALLLEIDSLNDQIVAGQGDQTTLADARDTALQTLSGLVGVTSYTDASGRLNIYAGGQMLVGTTVSTLSFTASGAVSSDSAYPTSLSGVSVNGRDVTSSLTGGELGALIDLRDEALPAEQAALDSLAATLISAVNTAASTGAASPPGTLTSTAAVTAATPLSLTGSLGVVQSTTAGVATAVDQIDLSTVTTVGELMDALNGVSGVTASIVDGKLTISSSSGGVTLDSSVALTADGETLTDWMGFNDVFSGDDASTIRVVAALTTNPGLLAASSLDTSAAVGQTAVASGGAGGAVALMTALTEDRSFAESGNLSARSRSLMDYATDVLSGAATTISTAASTAASATALRDGYANSLSNATGVNLDEQTALVSLYQQQYEISAQLMAAIQAMYDALISMVS